MAAFQKEAAGIKTSGVRHGTMRQDFCPGVVKSLKRPALQKVEDEISIRCQIDRILDIDRILIGIFQRPEDRPEGSHQFLIFYQAFAGDEQNLLILAAVAEGPLRLPVMFEQGFLHIKWQPGQNPLRIDPHQLFFLAVDQLDLSLGIAMPVGNSGVSGHLGPVQSDDPGIRAFRPVDGRRPEPHNQAQHSRFGISVFVNLPGTAGIAYTGRAWHEIFPVMRAGDPLDQQRHLLIPPVQSSLPPVVERRHAHGTGVDSPDRIFQFFEPLLRCPGVGAENGLILARKRISKPIFQNAAGADDIGVMAIIIEQKTKAVSDRIVEAAALQFLRKLLRAGKVAIIASLFQLQIPETVVDDIGIKDVGAEVEGIVRLKHSVDIRDLPLNDLPCEQHAAGLASDHSGSDHAVADLKIVLRLKSLLDQLPYSLIAAHHDVAHSV